MIDNTGNEIKDPYENPIYMKCLGCNSEDYCMYSEKWKGYLCPNCAVELD